MNIIEKYNQDKETTIQADISEFLHFNFSNYIMQQLKCRKDPNVKKLLSLFPLQPDTRKSEIKKIIDKLENILSYDLLDDIKDEFRDIWDDYKWANSKDGKGTIIDLKDESEFAIYNQEHLNRLRITNYSPDRLAKHHCEGKHEYFVSDYVLNADVIINMPKPKTHRKAGVTIALKNLVGINVRKEFLPHHTIGSVKEDGDEYRKKSKFRKISSIAYDYKNKFEGEGKYVRAFFCLVVGYGIKIISNKCFHDEMEGSWSGNHTISKTIVDLNKILLYADKNGNIQLERQRKLLNIADMIISGEKEGPVAPSPKYVGYLVLGEDSESRETD